MTVIFPTFSQKYVKRFFRSVYLIKWLHYRPFSGKLPTISEHSKQKFFLGSAFKDVRNSEPQNCIALEKKRHIPEGFFGIFKIFEYSLLSEHSQNVSAV